MEFLAGRYGTAFMTDLHNEDANGLPGLQATLDKYLTGDKAQDVVHDWAAMVALDKALDDGAKLMGWAEGADRFQAPTPERVGLLGEPGVVLDAGRAAERLGLRPAARRGRHAGRGEGHRVDRVLEPGEARRRRRWSGSRSRWRVTRSSRPGAADDIDRSIVRSVSVPANGDRTLTFDTRYGIETGWDFGFVQVSTDDGPDLDEPRERQHDRRARPGRAVVDHRRAPGAQRRRRLARRVVRPLGLGRQDGAAPVPDDDRRRDARERRPIEAGWLVDDVKVGGTLISDGTLAGWGPRHADRRLHAAAGQHRGEGRQAGHADPGVARRAARRTR